MSKFKPIGEYRAVEKGYSLLPFKFERLSDDNVVVTNQVGEFAFITLAQLTELVEKRLNSNTPEYSRLRSIQVPRENHDQWAIDLLALKTRTRLLPLRNFTNLHLFIVTLRCDHSCQYCQVSRQSDDKTAFDMTQEIADKGLDIVFRSPNKAVKIEFQGGKPLLNFDLIKHIVESAEERNVAAQKELQFVIATTLSLATTEILEYCKSHNILLSASLDGPEDLHNKNQPRPGRDSYAKFAAGLAQAREIVGIDSVSALMTTSPASMNRVTEIIDEYLAFGFDGIFLRHLSPYGFAIKRGWNTY